MNKFLRGKFEEWTQNLPDKKARINIFENMRDIPYAVILEHFDCEKGPERMIRANKGFCVPKHYLLAEFYKNLGLQVRLHTFLFRWEKINADYPRKLKDMAKGLSEVYHLACGVLIENNWVIVDATWDIALEKTGLPVNKIWDGASNTLLAVKPEAEYIHDNINEREDFLKNQEYSLSEKLRLSRFSLEFNKWLEAVRKQR